MGGSKYNSKTIVYRDRANNPVAEMTEAKRLEYDEYPDLHKLKTGEETRGTELRGITQVYDSDEPVYYMEHKGKILLFRGVTDRIDSIETSDGQPLIHFYEGEAGQLLNFIPEFGSDSITGDYHKELEDRLEEGKGLEDVDWSETTIDKPSVKNYVIDDKDERLTAIADHRKRKDEKYKSDDWLSEHSELAYLFVTALGIAAIMAIFFQNMGDMMPLLQDLNNNMVGLQDIIQNFITSQGGSGTPPGN